MPNFRAMPLRRQLFLAILLLLVPVGLAAFWSGLSSYRERLDELAEQADITSRTIAAFIDRDLTHLDETAARLARSAAVVDGDAEEARALFGRILLDSRAILRLALAGPDGAELAAATANGRRLDAVDWSSEVLETGQRTITGMQSTTAGDLRFVVVGYPVRDAAGTLRAALGVYMDMARLQSAFASLPLPQGSVVTIFSHEGRILARSLDAERYLGAMLSGGRQSAPLPPREATGIDGVDRVYAEAAAQAGPWLISVGYPVSLAADRAASLWTGSFTVLGLGLAGWLAVAVVLTRRLTSAVSHLDATAQRIAQGDFSPMQRKTMFSREFEELQSAFAAMLMRFNETRHRLDAQMEEERRIRHELESLQGQVIRQERLAAVGQLVSGVAHEINNPLQAILGFAELLQLQSDVPDSVKTDLKLIQKESARACGIIRNLALFARQQPGPAAPVRLADVIASVVELRQRRLESEDIQLQVADRSSNYVMAVLTELQQVVLNFVVNAEQAVLASGRLPGRITIRAFDTDDRAVLEVEDTGPGVTAGSEDKLFEPFFTTKPVGQGTGLGLSISYGIIDSLGGQIGYRRAAAGGSIFYFSLPIAAGEAAAAADAR